jgi:hypothetical protein
MLDKDPGAEMDAAHPDREGRQSAAQDASDYSSSADITKGLRAVGTIAAQTTLVASLLFYFGWARTQAILGYFGINAAVTRLSVNDYVLHSLAVTVKLLVVLGFIAIILLAGHRYLATLMTRHHPHLARVASFMFVLAGAMACIAGALGFYNWVIYSTRYPFVPIFLAIGVTLVSYGFYLYRFWAQGSSESRSSHPKPSAWPIKQRPHPEHDTGSRVAQFQIIATLVVDIALIFWAVAVYANIVGQQAGKQLASNLEVLPRVVVYSETSLGLTDRNWSGALPN